MISSSGSTATGLKKWNPTTRSGCSRSAAISVTDSDEVLVARIASGRTIFSRSAKIVFFSCSSSNTASITKSASANTARSTEPVTSAFSWFALSGADPALAEQLVDLAVHVPDALVDPLLVEVGEHHRHLEPPYEQQCQLARHQAGADDADLGDRAGQRLVRRTGRALGPLVHQVEGVEAAAQLLAHDQVGERLVLGREPAVAVVVLRRRDQLQRPVRRRAPRRSP